MTGFSKAPTTHNVNNKDEKTILELSNPTTGEITEWDITTDEGLARSYEAATKLETALKKAKDSMKAAIRERMGEEEHLQAGVYFQFKLGSKNTYGYDISQLRNIIDEDTIMEYSKIDTKRFDQLLTEYKAMGLLNAEQLAQAKAAKIVMGSSDVLKVERLLKDE